MNNKVTILIVEDDDAAAHLIQANLRRADLQCNVLRASDGKEGCEILEMKHPTHKLSEHDKLLILLDIRMPKMDGIEMLRYIKQSVALKQIPVIMLTTTDDPREVENCYKLGCNFYITKPVDYGRFVKTIKNLAEYIKVCTLPINFGVKEFTSS